MKQNGRGANPDKYVIVGYNRDICVDYIVAYYYIVILNTKRI